MKLWEELEHFIDFQSRSHTGQNEKVFQDSIQGGGNQGKEPDFTALTHWNKRVRRIIKSWGGRIKIHLCLPIAVTQRKSEFFSYLNDKKVVLHLGEGACGREAPTFPREVGDKRVVFDNYISKRWI